MVDLREREEPLTYNRPRLVAVGIVTDTLGSQHHGCQKQRVTTASAGSGEVLLESLEEVQRVVGHYLG